MAATRTQDDLIQLHVEEPRALVGTRDAADPTAANGAPAGEPETWDPAIPAFNPRFAHTPEPPALSPELASEFADEDFDIDAFLAGERDKDLLRFSTAGSVDDGKSTLIGRLLYDTRSVYEDQVRSIEGKGSAGAGVLDLALLTDGLRAEREQGITIDVAYRYFSTARRKFIIADTPGHVQYTRNMATGASTADVAIVLVDARRGVLPQSRRHAWITALLGVRHVIVAINKMDLVQFSPDVFKGIVRDFESFFRDIDFGDGLGTRDTELFFVPVSALAGDNVALRSRNTPWYDGSTLLELLEGIPVSVAEQGAPFRLAVQRVVRPNLDFRGFAGQIASGTVRPGDPVLVLPSGRSSRVTSVVTFDGELPAAAAPLSVTVTLEDEIDISRGDLLTTPEQPATVTRHLRTSLVWMDETALVLRQRYLLKHTSRTVQAWVERVTPAAEVEDAAPASSEGPNATLNLNGIGLVDLRVSLPLAADLYASNRTTGSFVLIDPATNATVAAGMIRGFLDEDASGDDGELPSVSAAERIARWGHAGAVISLQAPVLLVAAVERLLFDRGLFVLRAPLGIAAELAAQGVVILVAEEAEHDHYRAMIGPLSAEGLCGGGSLRDAANTLLALFDDFESQRKGEQE